MDEKRGEKDVEADTIQFAVEEDAGGIHERAVRQAEPRRWCVQVSNTLRVSSVSLACFNGTADTSVADYGRQS